MILPINEACKGFVIQSAVKDLNAWQETLRCAQDDAKRIAGGARRRKKGDDGNLVIRIKVNTNLVYSIRLASW